MNKELIVLKLIAAFAMIIVGLYLIVKMHDVNHRQIPRYRIKRSTLITIIGIPTGLLLLIIYFYIKAN
jgi:flagellar biogenesis protein FliO